MQSPGKRVLVLGGTGAIGVYLIPSLARLGYRVDVLSLDEVAGDEGSNVTYIKADAKDDSYLREQLKTGYDAIVDLMLYRTNEFSARREFLVNSTGHYLFFSTYRVYAGEHPITEASPRLLDVARDQAYLAVEDNEYSLYKARQEDLLRGSGSGNWTIIRPAITYSKFRFQLITLEANTVVYRARRGLPLLLPREALPVQATMTWAGDVGEMVARLVLNPAAVGEAFTVSTAEHNTWREVAECYSELIGLRYVEVDSEVFLTMFDEQMTRFAGHQLFLDRCFERIVDNSKILAATGLKQSDLLTLRQGLGRELAALPQDHQFVESSVSQRMTEYLHQGHR